MFPYSYAADAFGRSYLLIAISFCETEAEDARLLCRCNLHTESRFLMADTLQTLVANARQQVAFLGVWHQHRPPTEQSLKDVADHILALLLIVEDRACHPQHLGVVLLEQPLDIMSFHHVFL